MVFKNDCVSEFKRNFLAILQQIFYSGVILKEWITMHIQLNAYDNRFFRNHKFTLYVFKKRIVSRIMFVLRFLKNLLTCFQIIIYSLRLLKDTVNNSSNE